MLSSEECIKRFINDYNVRLDKKTLVEYKIIIRQFLSFCRTPFYEITKHDIQKWLEHLNHVGNKPSTIRTKIFGIRLFYRYCLEEKIITNNPVETVPLPKVDDKLPRYLTNEQIMQLRLLNEGKLKKRAVIEVLYSTGVRISELISMKLEDINWKEQTIVIQNGKGKKERIVLFTKECAEQLKAYLQNRSDDLPYVFLNSDATDVISYHIILKWFKTFQKKLDFYLTPHTLRHTFAAHLVMKGMPMVCIQSLLGHDKPQNTHVYTRLFHQALKQKYDQLI